MKNSRTELVFVLDRSGSMSGLESDTIGGFNAMLKKQRATEGACRLTTVLFDHEIEILHDRIDLQDVSELTDAEYCVRGSTALLDAMGFAIQKITGVQKTTSEKHRADNVVFVIITDGFENASREFTSDKVKKLIQHRQSEFGWEFIFIGANIDAVETAGSYGIPKERAQDFLADKEGIGISFDAMSHAVSELRSNRTLSADWNADIKKDYQKRKKRDDK